MIFRCFFILIFSCLANSTILEEFLSPHSNNWAVLVSSSRFWFNYRHISNTLSIYSCLKRLGIPDSHIILMLADEIACNSRNPYAPYIFDHTDKENNLYFHNIEVDYKGYEVNVENFFRVLTGRQNNLIPNSKSLSSDKFSNVLVYISGHGGDGFIKFQDSEELLNIEISDIFSHMWQMGRYKEILLLIDTCQASSMFQTLVSPNILAAGSSKLGEDSLSHQLDTNIGLHLIDKWTFYLVKYLDKIFFFSNDSIISLFATFQRNLLRSTPSYRLDLYPHDLESTLLNDFFGSIRIVYFIVSDSIKSITIHPRIHLKNFDEFKVFNNIALSSEDKIWSSFSSTSVFKFHSVTGIFILFSFVCLSIVVV